METHCIRTSTTTPPDAKQEAKQRDPSCPPSSDWLLGVYKRHFEEQQLVEGRAK